MPTYDNSTIDAAEASDALRGLAHASRVFDQPAEMYGVIGDLSSAMRSLHQVLDQLATNHENRAACAFNDDGNHDAGVQDALPPPLADPPGAPSLRDRIKQHIPRLPGR